MKRLIEIWNNDWALLETEQADLTIENICFDSREARPNSLFFALKGTQSDGHQFLQSVLEKGCKIAVVQEINSEVAIDQILVKDSHQVLAKVAHRFYEEPSKKLKLVGVTGTNGKTTTTSLLYQLFKKLGHSVGLISTVENKINDRIIPATHTTPNPVALSELLNQMVEAGCTHVFMEVSSHAIDQKRIDGLEFDVAVFTNITHDHLDYHITFAAYLKAKKAFFDQLNKGAYAITNLDDKNGMVMLQNTNAQKKTYSLRGVADFKAKILDNALSGLTLRIENQDIHTRLIGRFNASNLLAVYAVSQVLEQDQDETFRLLSDLISVDGRFQQVRNQKSIHCIVDYAHTPDALKNVLETIGSFSDVNDIITVVGCGGDRDKTKRPVMAHIASEMSSQCVFTSDNPRTENPDQILEEMETGISEENQTKVLTISDRKNAIKTALRLAKPGDVVLIAGKGHEKYQDIMGVKHPFDDYQIAAEFLKLTT